MLPRFAGEFRSNHDFQETTSGGRQLSPRQYCTAGAPTQHFGARLIASPSHANAYEIADLPQADRGDSDFAKIRVTLLLVAPNIPRTYRAISRIEKDHDKNVRITIELTACSGYFELLGHEFEHAAEQVEGINLKLLSTRKNGHVHRLDDGSYETDRAVEAGRTVARECSSNRAASR